MGMKINLYHEWLGPKGPVRNGIAFNKVVGSFSDPPHLYWYLQHFNVDVTAKHISDTIQENILKNEYNFYVIEIDEYQAFIDDPFTQYLDHMTVNLINNEEFDGLIIFFPGEGFSIMGKFMTVLHKLIRDKGILFSKVCFIFGDLEIKEKYHNAFNPSDRFGKIAGMNIWELSYQLEVKKRWFRKDLVLREKEFIHESEIKSSYVRPNYYLSLNGRIRRHRTLIISELIRRSIFQKGLVSYLGRNYEAVAGMKKDFLRIPFKEENREAMLHLKSYIRDWQPHLIDIDGNELDLDDRQQTKEMYMNTYFSLVTESHVDEDILFITEKTYKPIVNLHPFIIAGSQGTLKYLRDCGYKTFPEIFDESYDEESDPEKRIFIILNEMERICSKPLEELRDLYKQVWPKLLHNRKIFLEKDHKETFVDLFGRIT